MSKKTFIAARGYQLWNKDNECIARFTQCGDYGDIGKLYSMSVNGDTEDGKKTLKQLYSHTFFKGRVNVGKGKRMLEDLPNKVDSFYEVDQQLKVEPEDSKIHSGVQTSVSSPQSA